ncbi:MAG TPA: FAD:protein FMN transferase [Vicinamibacteria bacterium]|nr:FAD:protein FMN transferase [Vicinamibacteria bacterium]
MAFVPVRPAILTALAAVAAGSPAPSVAPPTAARSAVVFSGPTMGTRYTVRVVMAPGDEAENDRIRAAIDRELLLSGRLFSRSDPASEVSRLNAHASTEPLPVSPEMLSALALGRRASELTGGAFDVTVAPLVDAWGLGASNGPPEVPSPAALAALHGRIDYRLLRLDEVGKTVTKARPDVGCDVSALADGWAADRVASALVGLGHPDLLVDVGGDVSARGRRPDGSRWRVAVETPQPGKVGAVLELEDAAVATSGDYRRAWIDANGRPRSDVFDPRTLEPISHGLAAATVVDPVGAWADALATGLLVLGPDEGRALAVRERLAARLVLRQANGSYAEWSTPAFDAAVARAARPPAVP